MGKALPTIPGVILWTIRVVAFMASGKNDWKISLEGHECVCPQRGETGAGRKGLAANGKSSGERTRETGTTNRGRHEETNTKGR